MTSIKVDIPSSAVSWYDNDSDVLIKNMTSDVSWYNHNGKISDQTIKLTIKDCIAKNPSVYRIDTHPEVDYYFSHINAANICIGSNNIQSIVTYHDMYRLLSVLFQPTAEVFKYIWEELGVSKIAYE